MVPHHYMKRMMMMMMMIIAIGQRMILPFLVVLPMCPGPGRWLNLDGTEGGLRSSTALLWRKTGARKADIRGFRLICNHLTHTYIV